MQELRKKERLASLRYNKKAGVHPAFLTHVLHLRTKTEYQIVNFPHVTSCGDRIGFGPLGVCEPFRAENPEGVGGWNAKVEGTWLGLGNGALIQDGDPMLRSRPGS